MESASASGTLEHLATTAALHERASARRRALARLRPLLPHVEHIHRAQCLTKRPIHALLHESSGEAMLPTGDFVLKPAILGTREPYALAESAAGVISMLIEDEHAEVRLEAIDALTALAASDGALAVRGAELLVDGLTDDSERVRARALRRLGGLLEAGVLLPHEHARALLASLADSSAAVRGAAVRAVGRLTIELGADAQTDGGGGAAGALLGEALDALCACAHRASSPPSAAALVDAAASLGLRHGALLRPLLTRARREHAAAQQPPAAQQRVAAAGAERARGGHVAAPSAAAALVGGALGAAGSGAGPTADPAAPTAGNAPPAPALPPSAAPPAPVRALLPIERTLSLAALLHAAYAAAGAAGAHTSAAAVAAAGAAAAAMAGAAVAGAAGTAPREASLRTRRSRTQPLPLQLVCAGADQLAAARRCVEPGLAALPGWVWESAAALHAAAAASAADASAGALAARAQPPLGLPLTRAAEACALARQRGSLDALSAELRQWADQASAHAQRALAAAAGGAALSGSEAQPLPLPPSLAPLGAARERERARQQATEDPGLRAAGCGSALACAAADAAALAEGAAAAAEGVEEEEEEDGWAEEEDGAKEAAEEEEEEAGAGLRLLHFAHAVALPAIAQQRGALLRRLHAATGGAAAGSAAATAAPAGRAQLSPADRGVEAAEEEAEAAGRNAEEATGELACALGLLSRLCPAAELSLRAAGLWVAAAALAAAASAAAAEGACAGGGGGPQRCAQLAAMAEAQLDGCEAALARARSSAAAQGGDDGAQAAVGACVATLACPLRALVAMLRPATHSQPHAPRHAPDRAALAALARETERALAEQAPLFPPPQPPPRECLPALRGARVLAWAAGGETAAGAPPSLLFVREGWPVRLALRLQLSGWDARSVRQCALVARCAGGHCWRFALHESDVLRRRGGRLWLRACVALGEAPAELVDSELVLSVETSADAGDGCVWARLPGEALRMPTAEYIPSVLLGWTQH